MTKILGISAFYHDAAAAIVKDGHVLAAAQEERFTRVKHSAAFPSLAIKYCLEESGCSIDELDAVIFYDKPLLKFERLLETYYAFAPRGLISFLRAIPIWIREKLFLKKEIYDGLREVENYDKKKLKLLFSEHHLSHAASAFYTSPFQESAILTIDGVGEWTTTMISSGEKNHIKGIKAMHFPHSVGLLYSAFTYFLGFKVNSGEYKLMGLAPYGTLSAAETKRFISTIKSKIVTINEDGSIWMNQAYFNYATGLKMIHEKKWAEIFGFESRPPEGPILSHHCNLARAVQEVTEEIVFKLARETKRLSDSNNLCLAGGVSLNCVATGKLRESGLFERMYIQPASGDAGGSLGSALAAHYMYFNQSRSVGSGDPMQGTYLGPAYSSQDVLRMNRRTRAVARRIDNLHTLMETIAEELADGKVVGWFQGRMEFGPRALGNRSILADARDPTMQQTLNKKIKYREGFRPFAPSVLEEDAALYFKGGHPSPYMTFIASIEDDARQPKPISFDNLSITDKHEVVLSTIPAVTHVDYTARIQTVSAATNPRFHQLLTTFKEKSGIGMLVNTSFNVRGEPIVCTPTDAYNCFISTGMDLLVIENYLYRKDEQTTHLDSNQGSL